MNFEEVFDAI